MSNAQPIPREHGFFTQQPIIDKLNKGTSVPKGGWPDGLVPLAVQIACTPPLITIQKPYREAIDAYFLKNLDVTLLALTLARKEVNKMIRKENGKTNKVGVVRAYLQSPQYGFLRDGIRQKTGRQEPSAADIVELLATWGFETTKEAVRKARKELRKRLPELRRVLKEAENEKRRHRRL